MSTRLAVSCEEPDHNRLFLATYDHRVLPLKCKRPGGWRATALLSGAGASHEPHHFAGHRQAVWLGLGLPRVAARSLGRLSPPVCAAGAAAARTARRDVGWRLDHGDPGRTRRQSVPW